MLNELFCVPVLKYRFLTGKRVRRIGCCGGAGSFLIVNALSKTADVFVTSDLKYHEFFDANNQLLIADIGHYESEQFTKELLQEQILRNFPMFAAQISKISTNPINYL